MNNLSFEDKLPELNELLNRFRPKWQLTALNWLDYDDICQIIRIHVHKKWHLWDQSRPFKPWASMVISHQIQNEIRNNYSNYAKPCLKCPHYLGGDFCAITSSGMQSVECGIFKKWKNKKEAAYNIKLPLSIDDSVFTGHCDYNDNFNYEESSKKLHHLVMNELNDKHKMIYKMIFIDGASDEEVAKEFGFKPDSKKRKTTRYKQISNLKKRFYLIASDIIKNNDIL